ncbi:MAG: pyridoxamine 5'-phosphate oxidase family protein [bacterium]|nr:pyridoxamine 5'-phosphate oxidase family protein [bacterium]
MAKLPEAVRKAIDKQDVFSVATCSSEGVPNVVYVSWLKVIDDETVLISDNYFSKTRSNILSNPKMAFVVSDKDKGSFQVKGSVERLTDGPMFEEMQEWVRDDLPRVAAVVLHVAEVYNGAKRLI